MPWDISQIVLMPREGGGVLSQKVLVPWDISQIVLIPEGGGVGSLARKYLCPGTLAK